MITYDVPSYNWSSLLHWKNVSCLPGSLAGLGTYRTLTPSLPELLIPGLGSRAAFLTFANYVPSSSSPHTTLNRDAAQRHHSRVCRSQPLKIISEHCPVTFYTTRWQAVAQVALRPNAQLQPLVRHFLHPPYFPTCTIAMRPQ